MFWARRLLVLLGTLLVAGPASAQEGRGNPPRNDDRPAAQSNPGRGGSDRGENRSRGRGRDDNRPLSSDEIAQRVSRAEGFLKRLDANGDGKVDADEVAEGPGKFMIERMFSRTGKQPQYPITIGELKQAMENDLRTRGSGPPPGGNGPPPSDGRGGPPGFPGGPRQGPPGMEPPTSENPSFGRRDRSGAGGRGSGTRPSTMAPAAGPSTAAAPASPKTTPVPGAASPGAAPGPAKPGAPAAPAGATVPPPGTPASATVSAPRKPARFLTAWERLPKDLPDWFYDKDADTDGQVTMAEFSSHWTPETAAEFNSYDLNRDGIVTAAECLKTLAEREKQEKQDKPQGFPRERERRRGG